MQQIEQYIKSSLLGIYPDNEIQNFTTLILQKVCRWSTVDILLHKDTILSAKDKVEITAITDRLKNHEPIQYIFGECEFMDLSFDVRPGVLIPRPETEELVDLIITENRDKQLSVLDIGTGSGCIAITLARYLKLAQVYAWDISPEALVIAKENNVKNKTNVVFTQVNVLDLPEDVRALHFDVIVSNPPYVCEKEKTAILPNVLDHEPHLALFVPDNDPLLYYRKIGEYAFTNLNPSGRLYYEINAAYGKETQDMLLRTGFSKVEIIKDIAGKDRIIKAVK